MLDSRLGKGLIIAYAAITLIAYVTVFFCGITSCGHYLVLPVLPWALIVTQDLGVDFPLVLYPVFMLLNVSVAYSIGVFFEWLYTVYKERTRAS